MYFDEFVDSGRRKLTKSNSSQTGSSERSAPAGPKETLTLESFRQKLKDPEYAAKMLQNPQKLDALIAQLTSEQ
jgi:hypothetical protein